MGTEPDEVRTVKLTKKIHSTTPYTTREKQTASLKVGERKVEQKGQEGLSMTVYRNVYDKNGKLIESYVENKSKYKPMPEIVLVGTAKASKTEGESVPATAPEKETAEVAPPVTEEVKPEASPETAPPAEPSPDAEATQNQEAEGAATDTSEPTTAE